MADLDAFERLATNYRRLYHSMDADTLVRPVVAHVMTLKKQIRYASTAQLRTRLLRNYAEVAVLAGRLNFFDLHDPIAARGYFQLALETAREVGDGPLLASALAHASFLPADEYRYAAADQYLNEATKVADAGSVPIINAWICAIRSEHKARAGESADAHRALEAAESALALPAGEPVPEWLDFFDEARLEGFRGFALLRVGRVADARGALTHGLRRLRPTAAKQRSVYLVDLASTYVAAREIDKACAVAGEACATLQEAGYATGTERLRQFRLSVDVWQDAASVRALDEQMSYG